MGAEGWPVSGARGGGACPAWANTSPDSSKMEKERCIATSLEAVKLILAVHKTHGDRVERTLLSTCRCFFSGRCRFFIARPCADSRVRATLALPQEHRAAVHDENFARDESSIRCAQEQNRHRDFVRRSHALHRDGSK